ncbi:MAG: hypothetical protein AAGA17_00285 [Actinomycetota bacterium]
MSLEVGQYGWYWGPHPETGNRTGFRRSTSIAKRIDNGDLKQWYGGCVAKGIAQRSDLAALAVNADGGELRETVEMAADVGGANEGRIKGSALHLAVELKARGKDPVVTDLIAPQAAAFRRRMTEMDWTFERVEYQVVNVDLDLPVAGRVDGMLSAGFPFDLKTSKSVTPYTILAWEVQIAIYARARWRWDDWEDQWVPHECDQRWGVAAHVPFHTGDRPPFCDFYMLDLERGWRYAKIAAALEATIGADTKAIRQDMKAWAVNRDQAELGEAA